MWHFTKHVRERMVERGYSQEEVLMVLDGEVPSIVYISPKENTVDMYFGKVGDKFIMIPVDRTSQSIITVRAMRKGEKELYMKEVNND
jgi:broad-specificity NMP kinase